MQQIKLILTGEPLAKQSVKKGRNGFYQPERFKQRDFLYRRQIAQQLPKGFKPFTKWVQVEELLYITPPTKEQLKHAKKSAWLSIGGLIPRPLRPDLPDNLNKLPFDAMQKKKHNKTFVYTDDALVYIMRNSSKWYGLNPRIEITLLGE